MKKIFLSILVLISVVIVVAGCDAKPGESVLGSSNFAGQAIAGYSYVGCVEGLYLYEVNGQIVGSDTGCTTMNSQGVFKTEAPWCPTQTVEKDGQQVYESGGRWQYCDPEPDATDTPSDESAQDQERVEEPETGYGGSEDDSDHGDLICGEIVQCDNVAQKGFEGQTVCGSDLKLKKCSAQGVWENTGQSCVCPSKKKCVKGETCFGTFITGLEGEDMCGKDAKKWICVDGNWQATGKECICGFSGDGGGSGKCVETDKGKNYLIAGKVKYEVDTPFGKKEKVVAEDYCHTYKDGSVYLFEAICSDTKIGGDPFYYVQKKCGEGSGEQGIDEGEYVCKEGKCVVNPCMAAAGSEDSFQIPFKDAQLEKAVKEFLKLPKNKPVLYKDTKSVTKLMLDNKNIQDISGIEYFSNLNKLSLDQNFISDLSPLGCLKEMEYLYLHDNEIVDIYALKGLSKLKALGASRNKISDISAVKGLIQLVWVDWNHNKISDITAIKGLTLLTQLYVGNNQIVDINSVSGLINLQELSFDHNQISDISALSGLTQLKGLYLGENKISDISALKNLKGLFHLQLYTNKISDISVLSGLTKLHYLDLGANQILDIGPLNQLNELTILTIDSNKIVDISPIQELTQLKSFSISGYLENGKYAGQLETILPLKNLVNLKELDLAGNKIKDISVIGGFINLEDLNIFSNQIQNVTALKSLSHLEKLTVNDNPLPSECGNFLSEKYEEVQAYLAKCAK